ncbi:MAG: hypothetical protein ABMB14_11275 [Myxococcota bacterium]
MARTIGLGVPDAPTELGLALATCGAVLLVLDNLDAVDEDLGPPVTQWLADAPRLRILGTSRRRLGAASEQTLFVGPLTPPREPGRLDGEAAELFLDRLAVGVDAGAPDPNPELDPAEVVALLDALDGLPLAIEIAAAHAAIVGTAEVLRAVRRDGNLSSRRSEPVERHRSLNAIVGWSWERLSPRDREILVGLRIFRLPFDLSAASEILAVDGPVHDTVVEFVDRGLLHPRVDGATVRFALLNTVRAFLRSHPVSPAIEQRYVDHLRRDAEQLLRSWDGLPRTYPPEGATAPEELVHAATLCVEREPGRCGPLVVCALAAATSQGLWQNAAELLDRALSAELSPIDRVLVSDRREPFLLRAGKAVEATALRGQGAAAAVALGRRDLGAYLGAKHALGLVNLGRATEAEEALNEAAACATACEGNALIEATLDGAWGALAFHRDDSAAIGWFRRARIRLEDAGLTVDARMVRLNLAGALARFGREAAAEDVLLELITDLGRVNQPAHLAVALSRLALIRHGAGRPADASTAFDRAVPLLERWDLAMLPVVLVSRGSCALDLGLLDQAEQDAERSWMLASRHQDGRTQAAAQLLLGRVALVRRSTDAERHLTRCLALAAGLQGLERTRQQATWFLIQHYVSVGRLDAALARTSGDPPLNGLRHELLLQLGRPPSAEPDEGTEDLLGSTDWQRVRAARDALALGDEEPARALVAEWTPAAEDHLLNHAVELLGDATRG